MHLNSYKFNIKCPKNWNHYCGGWITCVKLLQENLHDSSSKIQFVINGVEPDLIEGTQIIDSPWIGLLHCTPSNYIKNKILTNPQWKISKQHCLGLYTFSNYLKNFLCEFVEVPIEKINYSTELVEEKFNWNNFINNNDKKLLFIGDWLRNFNVFSKVNYSNKLILNRNKRISDCEYNDLLSKNIVFLSLYDSSANTTVIECIARNTPLIINRLPALEEYLGVNYPLFYDNEKQIPNLLQNNNIILGYKYLKKLDKSFIDVNNFVNQIKKSNIYKRIFLYI